MATKQIKHTKYNPITVDKTGTKSLSSIVQKTNVISIDDLINFCNTHTISKSELVSFIVDKYDEQVTKKMFLAELKNLIKNNASYFTVEQMTVIVTSHVKLLTPLFKK